MKLQLLFVLFDGFGARRRPLCRWGHLLGGDQTTQAVPEIFGISPVAIHLLIDTGEKRVVVTHDLLQTLDSFGVQVFKASVMLVQAVVVLFPLLDQGLQRNQVEDPLETVEIEITQLQKKIAVKK